MTRLCKDDRPANAYRSGPDYGDSWWLLDSAAHKGFPMVDKDV
jgi:hypothetical protein